MEAVTIDLPGCKSASQRALLLAALATGPSCLHGLGDGADSKELAAALAALGVAQQPQADAVLTLQGIGGPPILDGQELNIGEGGSTLRFLLPLLARCPGEVRLQVAPGLLARPHGPLLELLMQNGARIESLADGFLIHGTAHPLPSPTTVPVALSSQFFSGLLMTSGATEQYWLLDQEPVSVGYLDMTVAMMKQFRGANCLQLNGLKWHQQAGYGQGQDYIVPADTSAALFFAVAAVLLQRPIQMARSLSAEHPDYYALQFLVDSGFMDFNGEVFAPLANGSAVQPFDLSRSPDSGPALAILAASSHSGLNFEKAERLRHKESDRIDGMARLAAACGAELSQEGGNLRIEAKRLVPAHTSFDPNADHRLAMAAGVAALRWPGIEITNPACVAKSFPTFWQQLDLLR
jgi:3-phosphoshikimate 1-carboxyvinyltransferase